MRDTEPSEAFRREVRFQGTVDEGSRDGVKAGSEACVLDYDDDYG